MLRGTNQSASNTARERACSKYRDLVGNIMRVRWYQRLKRIKNSSVPVREHPLGRWKVLCRYRGVLGSWEVLHLRPSKSQPIASTNHPVTKNECMLTLSGWIDSSALCLSYKSSRTLIQTKPVVAPDQKSKKMDLRLPKFTKAKGLLFLY